MQVIWNMVQSDPLCCPFPPPALDVLGFDEMNSKSRENVGLKMAAVIWIRKNVERCLLIGVKI